MGVTGQMEMDHTLHPNQIKLEIKWMKKEDKNPTTNNQKRSIMPVPAACRTHF